MKRWTPLVVALSLVLSLGAILAPAQAYPPGRDMTITANRDHIKKGDTIRFYITKARPNSSVRIKWGTEIKTIRAGAMGKASGEMEAPDFGAFVVKATNGSETASIRMWVPKIKIRDYVLQAGKRNRIELEYVKPGAIVTFRLNSVVRTKAAGTDGIVMMKFLMPLKIATFTMPITVGTDNLASFELRTTR